jgi:hypothetical protein
VVFAKLSQKKHKVLVAPYFENAVSIFAKMRKSGGKTFISQKFLVFLRKFSRKFPFLRKSHDNVEKIVAKTKKSHAIFT